jgi:Tol biopolymer transport system component
MPATLFNSPAWSPDGTMIAFHSYHDGENQICVMDQDGGDIRCLTKDSEGDVLPS